MQVKIGNRLHDSIYEPIMLILSHQDKQFIGAMEEDATKFCAAPGWFRKSWVKRFIKEPCNTVKSFRFKCEDK